MGQNGAGPKGPRCIALVGPFQSGKTTLLEAILARTGAVQRQGMVDAGTTVGDASKEARSHKMSVEASVATTNFMGDSYTFIDCPGSIEFIHDMRTVLPAVDAAVVVCEADEKKVPQLQLILRELEDQNIPHFLFLNKIDKADKRVRETHQAVAAGLAGAAAVAPDPDLERRYHRRLRRSRARARACLQGARAVRGDRTQGRGSRSREGSALHHAGDAGRSRRRADGAIARGHPAAARQGVRRSGQGIARGPDRARCCSASPRRTTACCACSRRCGTRRRASPRPSRGSAPKPATIRWRWCSRPSTPRTAARCRSPACSPAKSATAPPSIRRKARPGACPACSSSWARISKSAGRRRPAKPSRFGKLDDAKTGDTLSAGKTAHAALVEVKPYPPVLAHGGAGQGAQGRRQTGRRLHQAHRGGSLAQRRAQSPRTTKW